MASNFLIYRYLPKGTTRHLFDSVESIQAFCGIRARESNGYRNRSVWLKDKKTVRLLETCKKCKTVRQKSLKRN